MCIILFGNGYCVLLDERFTRSCSQSDGDLHGGGDDAGQTTWSHPHEEVVQHLVEGAGTRKFGKTEKLIITRNGNEIHATYKWGYCVQCMEVVKSPDQHVEMLHKDNNPEDLIKAICPEDYRFVACYCGKVAAFGSIKDINVRRLLGHVYTCNRDRVTKGKPRRGGNESTGYICGLCYMKDTKSPISFCKVDEGHLRHCHADHVETGPRIALLKSVEDIEPALKRGLGRQTTMRDRKPRWTKLDALCWNIRGGDLPKKVNYVVEESEHRDPEEGTMPDQIYLMETHREDTAAAMRSMEVKGHTYLVRLDQKRKLEEGGGVMLLEHQDCPGEFAGVTPVKMYEPNTSSSDETPEHEKEVVTKKSHYLEGGRITRRLTEAEKDKDGIVFCGGLAYWPKGTKGVPARKEKAAVEASAPRKEAQHMRRIIISQVEDVNRKGPWALPMEPVAHEEKVQAAHKKWPGTLHGEMWTKHLFEGSKQGGNVGWCQLLCPATGEVIQSRPHSDTSPDVHFMGFSLDIKMQEEFRFQIREALPGTLDVDWRKNGHLHDLLSDHRPTSRVVEVFGIPVFGFDKTGGGVERSFSCRNVKDARDLKWDVEAMDEAVAEAENVIRWMKKRLAKRVYQWHNMNVEVEGTVKAIMDIAFDACRSTMPYAYPRIGVLHCTA